MKAVEENSLGGGGGGVLCGRVLSTNDHSSLDRVENQKKATAVFNLVVTPGRHLGVLTSSHWLTSPPPQQPPNRKKSSPL